MSLTPRRFSVAMTSRNWARRSITEVTASPPDRCGLDVSRAREHDEVPRNGLASLVVSDVDCVRIALRDCPVTSQRDHGERMASISPASMGLR